MTFFNAHGTLRVGAEPEIRQVGETKVAKIVGVMVEKQGKGETAKEVVNYYDLELWDSAAEFVEKNLAKGDTLIVNSCTPRLHTWEDKTTKQKRSKTVFRVNQFDIKKRAVVEGAAA